MHDQCVDWLLRLLRGHHGQESKTDAIVPKLSPAEVAQEMYVYVASK